MPTWPDAAAFARELDALERDLARKESLRITRKMAQEAEQIAYRTVEGDLGGDLKFSGWAPELRLQVQTTKRFGHLIAPTRSSAGPWTVAEYGRNVTAGPFVRTGRDGRARRTRSGNVSLVRRRRQWNGVTQGKGTASEALRAIEDNSADVAEKEVKRVLRRRFDVT